MKARRGRKPIHLGEPMVSNGDTEDRVAITIRIRKLVARAAAADLLTDEEWEELAAEARKERRATKDE